MSLSLLHTQSSSLRHSHTQALYRIVYHATTLTPPRSSLHSSLVSEQDFFFRGSFSRARAYYRAILGETHTLQNSASRELSQQVSCGFTPLLKPFVRSKLPFEQRSKTYFARVQIGINYYGASECDFDIVQVPKRGLQTVFPDL